MKKSLKYATILPVLGALILAGGCQTPGKIVSTQTSDVCPQCKTDTVTTPLKGVTYKKHTCPHCKDVVVDDSVASSAMASYTSEDIEMVHVCKNCSSIVEPCKACANK